MKNEKLTRYKILWSTDPATYGMGTPARTINANDAHDYIGTARTCCEYLRTELPRIITPGTNYSIDIRRARDGQKISVNELESIAFSHL